MNNTIHTDDALALPHCTQSVCWVRVYICAADAINHHSLPPPWPLTLS